MAGDWRFVVTASTKPLPPHGTYGRANGRFYANIGPCGCPSCRNAEYQYDKQLRIDKAAGRDRTIDAADTAADVEYLAAAGMTYLDIAAAASCSKSSIYNLRKPGATITASLAARIAAVRYARSGMAIMPAVGATRRVRAVHTMGHTATAFATRSGLGLPYISELLNGHINTVRAETHDRIDATYRALINAVARPSKGATRARRRAQTEGWPPPLAWDNIDDPAEQPTGWQRSDERCGADLVEDAEFIVRTTGVSFALAAERLGVHRNTLERARERSAARAKRERVAA